MARLSSVGGRSLALLFAGALLGASVGVATGAIPSSSGQINACVNKTTGALRAINYPTVHCTSATETFLRWNLKGIPGPQGPAGAQGAIGAQGATGASGAAGAAGATGVSGYQIVTTSATGTPLAAGTTIAFVNSVSCPAGKVVVGGGADGSTFKGNVNTGPADIAASMPLVDGSGWQASLAKGNGSLFALDEGVDYTIYAICVNAT